MNEAESEAAADAVIAKAIARQNEAAPEVIPEVEAEIPEAVPNEDLGLEAEAVVPIPPAEGYMDHATYIEAGRDPEYFRGEKAYEKQKDLIAQLKESEAKFRTLDEGMLKLHQHNERQQEQREQELLRENAGLETRLRDAESALDIPEMRRIEADIAANKGQITPQQEQPAAQMDQDHPVIAAARLLDGRINKDAKDFNPDFELIVRERVNATIPAEMHGKGRPLTNSETAEELGKAIKHAETIFKPVAAPRVRPAEVSAPAAVAKKSSSVDEFKKDMMLRWARSEDKTMNAAGKRWCKMNNVRV